MASKVEIYAHYLSELKKLINEIDHYKSPDGFLYSNVMENYAKRYNKLLLKYRESTGIHLNSLKCMNLNTLNLEKPSEKA
jgi:hypothetical protein